MAEVKEEEKFTPRDYQLKLMEIAIKQNCILYLPTGSGKTFISFLVIKHMIQIFKRPRNEGGKLCFFLVNSVPLVAQHTKYLSGLLDLSVGGYTGDMQVDYWDNALWQEQLNKNQVLIMTAQILLNILEASFISLSEIGLLIFDECHHAVNDHPMRLVMSKFREAEGRGALPRVLGLTATLINSNCMPHLVDAEVDKLEKTFRATVSTVDELQEVMSFSTNPDEHLRHFAVSALVPIQEQVLARLDELTSDLKQVNLVLRDVPAPPQAYLLPLETQKPLKWALNVIQDVYIHIREMGVYGGRLALMAHTIGLERAKRHCVNMQLVTLYDVIITRFALAKKLFEDAMRGCSPRVQIFGFSSEKVRTLFEILKENDTGAAFCSIVFVQRRFTAKILFNLLQQLADIDPTFAFLKPDFMVGMAGRAAITVESSYVNKMNKKVMTRFANGEINLIISSDVLEEGIDIPTCTLIIKYDKPSTFRSYVQSKGRAREKRSQFFIMVEEEDGQTYRKRYHMYKMIEHQLTCLLVGKSADRLLADNEEEADEEIAPYFANGPGSAQVTAVSAISLLCRYCLTLPSDRYTVYQPNWFVNPMTNKWGKTVYQVVIELPLVSPVKQVEGRFMLSKKNAKRAAALEACIQLHKMKEFDDNLLPKVFKVEEDLHMYFKYWPEKKEKLAGTGKKRRLHQKQAIEILQAPIIPDVDVYLHIIDWRPQFTNNDLTDADQLVHDLYVTDLCFGLLTAQRLPDLCAFPLFVSLGEINTDLLVNATRVKLSTNDLCVIRRFNVLIYKGVLGLLKSYLLFDNRESAETMLVVPVRKSRRTIAFDVLHEYRRLEEQDVEPSSEAKANLIVSDESYRMKIVTPWYRPDDRQYVVTSVCTHLNAYSPFPSINFKNFIDYFTEQYRTSVLHPDLPLLLVKGLSQNRQCLLPRGDARARRRLRDQSLDEIHFLPELCVKQEFPACLWVQATLIPSCLYRVCNLLAAEQLRAHIESEIHLGAVNVQKWDPLILRDNVVVSEPKCEMPPSSLMLHAANATVDCISLEEMHNVVQKLNQDFALKKLESQFPWLDRDEPVDIERNLYVTLTDIQDYDNFMSRAIDTAKGPQEKSPRAPRLALEYDVAFAHRDIELLAARRTTRGPQLRDVYEALCAKKSNEIVNYERLETLGDSFLKFAASLYIFLTFARFNEGRATTFKGALISNRNLYYLGAAKRINGYVNYNRFDPTLEWRPPGFCIPSFLQERIERKELPTTDLFNVELDDDEQASGHVGAHTRFPFDHQQRALKAPNGNRVTALEEGELECDDDDDEDDAAADDDELFFESIAAFLGLHIVPDKTVADCVEALIGLYFHSYGLHGGLSMIEWLEVVPAAFGITRILHAQPPDPIVNPDVQPGAVDLKIPTWADVERELGYHFKNRAYLLEALTHPTYTPNRITNSYERLEFLGDAILDFLITCHIYESCGNLDPGQLTDLRSALVNNVTFAGFAVRHSLQKHLLFCNSKLADSIGIFVKYQTAKGHAIGDDVQILSEENDLCLGEYADVPKVLGDVFEALAGAIFLDSGMDLNTVWRVFYRIMWKEIAAFSSKVPKNAIRLLYENTTTHPQFSDSKPTDCGGTVMVGLDFMLRGERKRVHGFGVNKATAKRAAAKIALRLLGT